MDLLGKIIGSPARVKLMKLFLFNSSVSFTSKDAAKRSRIGTTLANKEIKLLLSVGFIKKVSRTSREWIFNPNFKYTKEFENLLVGTDHLSSDLILSYFKKFGRLKLFVISGIFIKNNDTRVDLLIVGDRIKQGRMEESIRKLEAEIGKELSYAIFDTEEFLYRLNMYDKLIRDILDFPHEVVLQAKELSTQLLKKGDKLI